MDHSEQKKPEKMTNIALFLSHESSKLHRNEHTPTHNITTHHITSKYKGKGGFFDEGTGKGEKRKQGNVEYGRSK